MKIKAIIKPALKWAGGKNQISELIIDHFPESFINYYEPFVGAGAIFLKLQNEKTIINDTNKELYALYNCFKSKKSFIKLVSLLEYHEQKHSKDYYNKIRNIDRKKDFLKIDKETKAARLVYLNKTCFNGIYRVNKSGFFNVPWNGKEKVKIFDYVNLIRIFDYFSTANLKITNLDFEKAVSKAKKGDLIYFDPPYDPLNKTSSFTSYTNTGFDKNDQIRLKNLIDILTKKGVYIVLSNSDTEFIRELYKKFNVYTIKAKRTLNSKADKRGYVNEVLITNYVK
jgi:DNA adenine methylase